MEKPTIVKTKGEPEMKVSFVRTVEGVCQFCSKEGIVGEFVSPMETVSVAARRIFCCQSCSQKFLGGETAKTLFASAPSPRVPEKRELPSMPQMAKNPSLTGKNASPSDNFPKQRSRGFGWLFDDVGATLKAIAKVCFYLCFWIGVIVVLIGTIKFFSGIDYVSFSEGLTCTAADVIEHESLYADCYFGRQIVKAGLFCMLGALSTLPLYGFGELIQTNRKMNKRLGALIGDKKE